MCELLSIRQFYSGDLCLKGGIVLSVGVQGNNNARKLLCVFAAVLPIRRLILQLKWHILHNINQLWVCFVEMNHNCSSGNWDSQDSVIVFSCCCTRLGRVLYPVTKHAHCLKITLMQSPLFYTKYVKLQFLSGLYHSCMFQWKGNILKITVLCLNKSNHLYWHRDGSCLFDCASDLTFDSVYGS